jgi:hypothetical protein
MSASSRDRMGAITEEGVEVLWQRRQRLALTHEGSKSAMRIDPAGSRRRRWVGGTG